MKTLLALLLSTFLLHAAVADDSPPPAPQGKQVLVLIERGFNREEFEIPARMLRAAGHVLTLASRAAGRVPLKLAGTGHPSDVTATVAMADIADISAFDALFIPGGYSPGFLEADPDAQRIARAFMESGKPVAAICHGPRVLMAAGCLAGRVGTMLQTVPSEKADAWRAGRAAAYLDQPVVIDGNLITSRYPNDAAALGNALLDMLAGKAPAPRPSGPRTVYLALWSGFDEAVALAVIPFLQSIGLDVRFAAAEPGWVRGLHGYPLPVDVTYDNLPSAAAVIAPGGVWPKPGPARQADAAPWVAAQAPALEARKEWIRATWLAGGRVLLCGLDSEIIAGWEAVAAAPAAASAQLEWSFPRGGPKWTREPLAATAPNLWTASGAAAVPAILREVLPAWAPASM